MNPSKWATASFTKLEAMAQKALQNYYDSGCGARPCGAMKVAKSCKEGAAANQRSGSEGHRFETWCQQGCLAVESPLKCTLPLVICKHNINSCVRCIDWLFICFTCERCDMSSINKRSTRKKIIVVVFNVLPTMTFHYRIVFISQTWSKD